MKGLYNATDAIETVLNSNPLIDRVSYGDKEDINESKGSVGSFAQIWVTNSSVDDSILSLGLTVVLGSKATEENEKDIFNKLAAVAGRLASELQYGSLHDDGYQMTASVNMTPLYPQNTDTDGYAGWALDFTIEVLNDVHDD